MDRSRRTRCGRLIALLALLLACLTAAPAAADDLPLPASLRAANLQPHTGDKLERASLPLEQILERLQPPDFLENADAETDADAEAAEPVPALTPAVKLYAVARDAVHQRDYRQALAAIQRAVNLEPESAKLRLLHAQILLELRRFVDAVETFRKTLELDPDQPTALYRLGRVAFSQNRYDEAIVILARAAALPDKQIGPGLQYMCDYLLGQSLLRLNYDAAAVAVLERYFQQPEKFNRSTTLIAEVFPIARQRGMVAVQAGDAQHRLAQPEAALASYETASESSMVGRAGALPRQIYTLLMLDRDAQAEQLLLDGLGDDSARRVALELIDYVAGLTDDRDRFLQSITDAYAADPGAEYLVLAVATVAGDLASKRELLRQHVAAHPDHEAALDQLVKLTPADELGGVLRLTIKLADRSPARARQMVRKLFDAHPSADLWQKHFDRLPDNVTDSAAAWYVRGAIAQAGRAFAVAEEAFNRAIDRNPDYLPATHALIQLLIDAARPAEALQLAETINPEISSRVQYLKALAQAELGQTTRALQTVNSLLESAPRDSEYRLLRAQLLIDAGHASAGEQEMHDLLEADPVYEPVYQTLFERYNPVDGTAPNLDRYNRLVQRVRSVLPASRTARLQTAIHLAAVEQQPARAERLLRDLLADNPGNASALRWLVRVLNEADRTDDIIELLTSRLDQAPRDGNALALLLQVARSADRVDDLYYPYAERFYQQSPFSVPYIIALADVYLQQKKFEQSIELFKRAIEAHPEDQLQLQLHMAFAEFNAAAGNYSRALTLVDRAMQLDDSFYLVAAKARYQSKAGQADAAVKTLNDAIAQAGPEESLYLRQQVAQVYAEMDKVDEAMKIYDALVTEYPDFAADFRYEASIVAAQAGAHDVAEQQLLKALDHNPDHAGANNNLGYTWVEAGKNLRRAEAMIRKAVAAEPNQAAYLDSLGWVLYKQGKFTEAVLWLRRAQQARGGNDPIILDHLGDALWQTGEHESAEQIWSVAIGQLRRMKEPSADHKSTLKSLEAKIKALENDQTPAVADVHEPEASEPQLPPAPLQ